MRNASVVEMQELSLTRHVDDNIPLPVVVERRTRVAQKFHVGGTVVLRPFAMARTADVVEVDDLAAVAKIDIEAVVDDVDTVAVLLKIQLWP